MKPPSEISKHLVLSKLQKLGDNLKSARRDYAVLRQEANDLQEFSNAKLDRLMRYLGRLADKTRELDQAALEAEGRITPLIREKKRLFNDLLTVKGSVKVFCRTRPLFENEGPSVVDFPDEYTVRVSTSDESLTHPNKVFELDRVYGPLVGQSEVFIDVQPYVQSALDGYNVSVFAYGQTHSGKTYTLEGSSHDRGLYARCFEKLFDLSNLESTTTSRFSFSVTVFELYNEQVKDLLAASGKSLQKVLMGSPGSSVECVSEKVNNPQEFSRVLKTALQSQGPGATKLNVSHLIVTIHIYYNNAITGENLHSKLSLVDLAGSECLATDIKSGKHVANLLPVMNSLLALRDVLSSLTSKKNDVPYDYSLLTKLLADSIGESSKTVMIVNICPDVSNVTQTLLSLNYSSIARSAVLSLGVRDTVKKWRDIANDARIELYEKEKELLYMKQEVISLRHTLEEANDQFRFDEVQKAWKVSYTLQSDLTSEDIADKHKIDEDQNAQLRNQFAPLLQAEQEQKLQIQERDLTIQKLHAKIGSLEQQLNEALSSNESRPGNVAQSNLKVAEANMDSSSVTKELEEELSKSDAMIEVSSPFTRRESNAQAHDLARSNTGSSIRQSSQMVSGSAAALVKTGNEVAETTPNGIYLIAALSDFDPEQYEDLAALSDGANRLLMLVLAAVIKAGASKEHEILAEIKDAVFLFIRKMEHKRVMDTILVCRVRMLYIRSLIVRSPELQSIKVAPVERFLEKARNGRRRSSCPGSAGQIQGFKVNIKQEKKSKISSAVLKLWGIDEETWRCGKLREITEKAKAFGVGNKALAALFVHTPAGELLPQVRSWLAENFDFLSITGDDAAGSAGQLELLSTAILDGWMAGLGAALPPSTDALGQLLSEYTKRVYTSQLKHLEDVASTLAMEVAEDPTRVAKLHSALLSVGHERRKILQQMKGESTLLTLEGSGLPIYNPSTATEDARLASLIYLDGILTQVKDITKQASNSLSKTKKRAMLASLDELAEQMPSLLEIDHPCAQRQIAEARSIVESAFELEEGCT